MPALVAGKARMLGFLLRKIKEAQRAPEASVRRTVADYVETFNALSLPKCYLYVDPDGLCHVVHINCKSKRAEGFKPGDLAAFGGAVGSSEVQFGADVIWDFNPQTGIWNTTKDRTGDFQALCPMKCGGIPERKVKT